MNPQFPQYPSPASELQHYNTHTHTHTKMSSMEQIAPIIATLNIEQKLTLIEDLVSSIRNEGGIAPKATKAKGKKKTDGDAEKKPKKKAALGTLAWTAYVKHMKQTRPDEFEGITKESEKLVIIKGIRAENPEEYVTWTDAWKAEHKNDSSMSDATSDSASVTSEVAEVAPTPAAPTPATPTPAKKSAKEVAQAKAAEKASVKSAKEAEKEAKAAAKEAEKTAKAAAKAEKPAKKPVKTAKKAEEETPKKEIDGISYWHHPENNALWEVIDGESFADGCGGWVGYFQPGNDDEPIRYTKAFGSDEPA